MGLMNSQPIGVFDSGLGGLSIFKAARDLLNNNQFIYLADQANCPYGGRSKKEIQNLTAKAVEFLAGQQCRLIVLACNTATVSSIDLLRKQFSQLYFVGVVPVVKPAAAISKTGHLAILSTEATKNSLYLKGLIDKYAQDKTVYNCSCPGLVDLIEAGCFQGKTIKQLLKNCLESAIKDSRVDMLATGCTHFSFVQKEIAAVFKRPIKFLDAGRPVAEQTRRVFSQIYKENLGCRPVFDRRPTDQFYTTGDPGLFNQTASQLLGFKVEAKKVKL